MESVTEDKILNKKVWLFSIKVTLKVLFIVTGISFYFLASMFYISPQTNAKVYNFFGFTKAEEGCYQQIYKKSNKTIDLYNLILFEQNTNSVKKELLYINEIFLKEDYEDFCEKLDISSILNAKDDKNLIVTVGDVNSYLVSRKVKCMYEINKSNSATNRSKSIQEFVRRQLSVGSATEQSFYTYVFLVVNDDTMSTDEKKNEFETFKTLYSIDNEIDTLELLEEKERKLVGLIDTAQSDEIKIIVLNALVKFYKASYNFNELIGTNSLDLEYIKDKYNNIKNLYLSMLN